MPGRPVAVYVHIPFCPSKCGYCDFNSYAMQGEIMERTTSAIIAEIERSPVRGRPARTIFFGGGTPTFIPAEQLAQILEAVLECHPPRVDPENTEARRDRATTATARNGASFGGRDDSTVNVTGPADDHREDPIGKLRALSDSIEITSEANPGTVDAAKFQGMREMKFNRISLGAQSFEDGDLVRLGRVHGSGEIERAVRAAREAGFWNINLDLMFALPRQSIRAWRENLKRAIDLRPDHLSLYCLTLEPNTPFYKQHLRGELIQPDDEAQVAMYEEAVEQAGAAGYGQYEISNFAKPGFECRHNLCYWQGEEYAGYGPGAVGCLQSDRSEWSTCPSAITHCSSLTRYTNLKHPERYCAASEKGEEVAFENETLDEGALRTERIMLSLRLNEGLRLSNLAECDVGLRYCLDRGWLAISNGRATLTKQGRHFCSEVALALI